jgi:hypothetical protein
MFLLLYLEVKKYFYVKICPPLVYTVICAVRSVLSQANKKSKNRGLCLKWKSGGRSRGEKDGSGAVRLFQHCTGEPHAQINRAFSRAREFNTQTWIRNEKKKKRRLNGRIKLHGKEVQIENIRTARCHRPTQLMIANQYCQMSPNHDSALVNKVVEERVHCSLFLLTRSRTQRRLRARE